MSSSPASPSPSSSFPASASLAAALAAFPAAPLALCFAGQGQAALGELRRLLAAQPALQTFVTRAAHVLRELAALPEIHGLGLHSQGLDVAAWLQGREVPAEEYLLLAHVSFPLNTLLQLCNYAAFLAATHTTHPQLLAHTAVALGHSQGVLAAAALALAGTEEQYHDLALQTVQLAFWIGTRAQQVTEMAKKANAHLRLPPRAKKANPTGTPEPEVDNPTFMLAFSGLAPEVVAQCCDELNKSLRVPEVFGARVTLINGPRNCVVSAPPVLTAELRARMGERRAGPKESEPRVPYSQRKLVYKSTFLPISVGFHHPTMDPIVELVTADCKRVGLHWSRKDLKVALLSTETGRDLRSSDEMADDDLITHLTRLISVRPVNWCKNVAALSTEAGRWTLVLDFGPSDTIARLTARNAEGTPVLAVACVMDDSANADRLLPNMLSLPQLYEHLALKTLPARFASVPDWRQYCPRLVQRASDSQALLDTRFTRLVGRPPLLVAGMTPTTSLNGVPLVAAATNAGYYAELAAGGLSRRHIFKDTIDHLCERLQPGQAIWLNLLYLNAKQWAFQFPLALSLRKQGYPIESITVAAGIPTPDKAAEIVARCKEAGLLFLSFKPGSTEAIHAVLAIAKAHADYPFVVQWTGGRGGGHHSFEDMHEPILETYAQLRACRNVVLVAGSGFGDGPQSLPYLDGSWSTRLGFNAMPFDGILLASRMMVAREAATAPEIKQLIVDTPGVANERQWETSYNGDAGGVITVTSELGEPIHKIATRGVLLWREMDRKFFSLQRGEKRDTAIAQGKQWIIERLNADFQKPYFGRNAEGQVVDLSEMTYSEVLARMVDLMYVSASKQAKLTAAAQASGQELPYPHPQPGQGRWLDPTFCTRVQIFAQRAEERSLTLPPGGVQLPLDRLPTEPDTPGPTPAPATPAAPPPPLPSPNAYAVTPAEIEANPAAALEKLFQQRPSLRTAILCEEDYDFFLELCQSGGKPVNFIPIIDSELGVWFKKDSLWYSEDLGGVPDADPQRVIVLQGPVSAYHTRKANEPAAVILDDIVASYRDALAKTAAKPLTVDALLGGQADLEVPTDMGDATVVRLADKIEAHIPAGPQTRLPVREAWLTALAPADGSWLWALLHSRAVACGVSLVDNPVLRILLPSPDQHVLIDLSNNQPTGFRLIDSSLSKEVPVVEITHTTRVPPTHELQGAAALVSVTVRDLLPEAPQQKLHAFTIQMGFFPTVGACPFRMAPRERAVKASAFYRNLWLAEPTEAANGASAGATTAASSSSGSSAASASVSTNGVSPPSSTDHAAINGTTPSHTTKAPPPSASPTPTPHSPTTATATTIRVGDVHTATFTPTKESVLAFCNSIRHGDEKHIPLDYAIVAAWQPLVRSLFADALTADLFRLVHLSNAFTVVPASNAGLLASQTAAVTPTFRLHLNEALRVSMQVMEISISETGKTVTVQGHLSPMLDHSRGLDTISEEKVPQGLASESTGRLRVTSKFFIRGVFDDYEQIFREEQLHRLLTVDSATLAAILSERDWLKWTCSSSEKQAALAEGARLFFSVTCCERAYVTSDGRTPKGQLAVKVRGQVTKRLPTPEGVVDQVVAEVELAQAPVTHNVVRSFLQQHARPPQAEIPLAKDSYSLLEQPKMELAPASNVPYALASTDMNPIHRHKYFAHLADLPTTIVHGMWSSAAARRLVVAAVAEGQDERVTSYEVAFDGMVRPGEELFTTLRHVALRGGNVVVSIETVNANGDKVLSGRAEVVPARSAYVFTGQGSAEQGMGMDLYNKSPVARQIWDKADRHLLNKYGFSILEIVRRNPHTITINFGGRAGNKIRQNYLDLQPKGSSNKLLAIDGDTSCYTFRAVTGLLFATQFTQVALVLQERAAFSDLRAHGALPNDFLFAGHSLGEYAALASVSDVFTVESLVDVTFLRGLVMQKAVQRDAMGRSEFGMVAANPLRVGPALTDQRLHDIVESVDKLSGKLVQVVNYNVKGLQYVVAGHVVALEVLSRVLTRAASKPQVLGGGLEATVKECLSEVLVAEAAAQAKGEVLQLVRGTATIPLPGIDVPFHSRYLQDGVPAFRSVLQSQFDVPALARALPFLIHRYIPNVVAVPFQLTHGFLKTAHEATGSPLLAEALKNWASLPALELGRLLLIELLAFQFASPVRWIETQHFFFTHGVRSLVEIGPAPTLANMALTTLSSKDYGNPKLYKVLFYGRPEDQDALYYRFSDTAPSLQDFVSQYAKAKLAAQQATATSSSGSEAEVPTPPLPPPPPVTPSKTPAVAGALPPPRAPAAAPAPGPAAAAPIAAASPVTDAPVTALEVLFVLLALKLKRPLEAIAPDTTIATLCGGKSALLNEIVADLEKEFGGAPDSAGEMTLLELSKTIEAGYTPLGDVTAALVARMISSKMPGGFGAAAVKQHLATKGLGPKRTDGVLLQALLSEPSARLSAAADAIAYLDAAAAAYSKRHGVTLSPAGAGGGGAAAAGGGGDMLAAMAAMMMAGGGGGGGAVAAVPDANPTALHVLRVLLASKLNKSVAEIRPDATIKTLVGGKSALENEIVADLEKEFGSAPDGGTEMPLSELAASVGDRAEGLGPVLSAMVARLLSSRMPGGFGAAAVRQHLAERHGLGQGRSSSVLAHGLTMQPADRITAEAEARSWLDQVAAAYAADAGIQLGRAGGGGGGGGGAAGGFGGGAAVVSSQALAALRKELKTLLHDQAEASNSFLGEDVAATLSRRVDQLHATLSAVELELSSLNAEHGEAYRGGILPRFDPLKIRQYDSAWNWARQTLMHVHLSLMQRQADFQDEDNVRAQRYLVSCASKSLITLAEHLAQGAAAQGNWRVSRWHGNLIDSLKAELSSPPKFTAIFHSQAPVVEVKSDGKMLYREEPRAGLGSMESYVGKMKQGADGKAFLSIQAPSSPSRPFDRVHSAADTELYFQALLEMGSQGVSFAGKVVLATGCGEGSIALEMVKCFLAGGATVIATTSSFGLARSRLFQSVYQQHGARGARLIVFPFNQASQQDVKSLVQYIYGGKNKGLGLDLDYVLPFGAISENGTTVSELDDKSELAHRMMATNVVRLLGAIKAAKEQRGSRTRPAHVILPLSPNHGIFGHDGLYAESKLALEALLNKRESERWYDYLNVVGAIIGWTRGTGLMASNNMTAPGVERLGCWTFSPAEMAVLLMALCHPRVVARCDTVALLANLGGGFERVENLSQAVNSLRKSLTDEAARQAAIAKQSAAETFAPGTRAAGGGGGRGKEGEEGGAVLHSTPTKRAAYTFEGSRFPPLPTKERRAALTEQLEGMVDLKSVAVVIGFGEVGPWGGSRTRWEMESYGEFSLEGCIELAWLTGLIRYHSGKLGNSGGAYQGWVDAASGEPVAEGEVKAKYEGKLLEGCGIRFVASEVFDRYDPQRKQFLQQIALDRNMPWVDTASQAEALEFRAELGEDQVDVRQNEEGIWQIRLRRGATVTIPKALRMDRFVAGQVPNGWSAKRYGLADDIVNQVDRVTLYSLVAISEALVAAGVTDAYEFYEYVHVAELGNTIGGGFGGMGSLQKIFHHRRMQQQMQGDVLQESFINTVPAWINMLLLSSSGPIRTPVGACATAAESVELAVEAITLGKAQVVVCGGYDDITEESMYEFGMMQATSNSKEEVAMGREPAEMCRPATTTRGGFMESHGAGMHVLCSAELAIQMGCPIYAVVALTSTATDKEGRSIPAPGQGILTTARERKSHFPSPMLDLAYRRRQLEMELASLQSWRKDEMKEVEQEVQTMAGSASQSAEAVTAFRAEREAMVEAEVERMARQARRRWGNGFFVDRTDIAPLRGALAVYGLTVDDVAVASFHGTGTVANDQNESELTNLQLQHLGRSRGNPLWVICQKWLTGHPKGAAAAWMLNGLIQCLNTGVVPGNRNLDNVSAELEEYEYLLYPNQHVKLPHIPAALLKSFGFGQAGAELVVIHPDRLLAVLDDVRYETYKSKVAARSKKSLRALHRILAAKQPLVKVKHTPPYSAAQQNAVYLDPHARARFDADLGSWKFADEGLILAKEGAGAGAVVPREAATRVRFDRREAEALLAAMRRGRQFGKLRDPAELLEERHFAVSDRRPGEFQTEDEAPAAAASEELEGEGIFRRSPRPKRSGSILHAAEEAASKNRTGGEHGIGIDVEAVATFRTASGHFLDRNFTAQEQSYCRSTPHAAHSFAGRWAAKEAVIKAMSSSAEDQKSLWKGAAAPLRDIEIVKSPSGAPAVVLHGHAKKVAAALGITNVKVSISYSSDHAVAQAVAQ